MVTRDQALQAFLDAARNAFCLNATDPRSIKSLNRIFADLSTEAVQSTSDGSQLPVCRYLQEVSKPESYRDPALRLLMEKFGELEPKLVWYQRDGNWDGASENFADNHANAILVGPKGLEQREDVWIGVTLVGPNIRYPDHRHTPEETYLVLSEGDFCQGRNDWTHVSTGETFYNPYNIVHSMRSQARPLFVFWALREKSGAA